MQLYSVLVGSVYDSMLIDMDAYGMCVIDRLEDIINLLEGLNQYFLLCKIQYNFLNGMKINSS